jgi:hypothetical protein
MAHDMTTEIAEERKELVQLLNNTVPLRSVDKNIIITT